MNISPGTSAVLVPTCKTNGLYFSGDNEPEEFKFNFDKYINGYLELDDDCLNITPIFDTVDDYYSLIEHCKDVNNTCEVHSYVTDDDLYTIDVHIDDDIDI